LFLENSSFSQARLEDRHLMFINPVSRIFAPYALANAANKVKNEKCQQLFFAIFSGVRNNMDVITISIKPCRLAGYHKTSECYLKYIKQKGDHLSAIPSCFYTNLLK
jgi:hypothetical protein